MSRKSPPATLEYSAARAAGHKRFLGNPCPACGSNDRLVSCRACYACHAKSRAAWSNANRERHKQMQRDWAKKNYPTIKERRKANGTYLPDPIKKHKYEQKRKAENPAHYKALYREQKKRRAHLLVFDDASRRYYMNSPTRKTLKHLTVEDKLSKIAERERGCAYCGEDKRLALDHIIPISQGGEHSIKNFQWLCNHHNSQKHTKTHDEYVIWCIERDVPLPLVYCGWGPDIEIFGAVSPAEIEISEPVSLWETILRLAA